MTKLEGIKMGGSSQTGFPKFKIFNRNYSLKFSITVTITQV